MKIPTRSVFIAQVLSTTITSIITIGIVDWQFAHIADFCSPANTGLWHLIRYGCSDRIKIFTAGYTCPSVAVFNTAATIWGGIG